MYADRADTIVAIATPQGAGGLGLIRLSGPHAVKIASSLFSPAALFTGAPSHLLVHGRVRDGGRPVDEVMAVKMLAPRSFTGEDVVELSAHGGPLVLGRIVRLCAERGARAAAPGEFTFRAFMNGRLDLAQAEAVADLIAARTERAAAAALSHLEGGLSGRIRAARGKLVDLLASIEAALDYAGEDIRFVTPGELEAALRPLAADLSALASSAASGRVLRQGLRCAIIGRPNTGKSSLLNALLGYERAIVTDVPGTTRDAIEETLDCRGFPLVVTDTAGLRAHALDPVERIGQERTLAALRNADVVLWVLDAAAPLAEADRHTAALLGSLPRPVPVVIVRNKADLPALLAEDDLRSITPAGAQVVTLSAREGRGLEAMEEAILAAAGLSAGETSLAVNERQGAALARAAAALAEAVRPAAGRESEEFVALHLREALEALGEITGETTTEEILANIFSRFCVGK